MITPMIWIHGDCLHRRQAPLRDYPGAPALFVFDDALLRKRQVSLKRILFIYECLLELPVTIRRGQVAAELIAFSREHNNDTIVTTSSVSPGFSQICRSLRGHDLQLILYEPLPFVDLTGPDLRRFSRYWRAAQPALRESKSR